MSSDAEYDAEPGKTPIWFGKHKGTRFEDLDEGYLQWCLHPHRKREGSHWYPRLLDLNDRYVKWFAEHHTQRSPGAIRLWFGMYIGLEFARVYNSYPGYLKAIRAAKYERYPWYYKILDLTDQYATWLEGHRRPYAPRRATDLIRDIGDKTGPWDDSLDAPDPDEKYEHDEFVVDDDEPVAQGTQSDEEEEAQSTQEVGASVSQDTDDSENALADKPSRGRLFKKLTQEKVYLDSTASQEAEVQASPKVLTRRRTIRVRSESPEVPHKIRKVVAPDDDMPLQ